MPCVLGYMSTKQLAFDFSESELDDVVLSCWAWNEKGVATGAFSLHRALNEKGVNSKAVNESLRRLEKSGSVRFCRMPQSGGMWVKLK